MMKHKIMRARTIINKEISLLDRLSRRRVDHQPKVIHFSNRTKENLLNSVKSLHERYPNRIIMVDYNRIKNSGYILIKKK